MGCILTKLSMILSAQWKTDCLFYFAKLLVFSNLVSGFILSVIAVFFWSMQADLIIALVAILLCSALQLGDVLSFIL
jgi:hypothetical protein